MDFNKKKINDKDITKPYENSDTYIEKENNNSEKDVNKSDDKEDPDWEPDNTKKSHFCEECQKRFRSDFRLKKHIEKVHEKKKPTCDICSESFSRRAEFYEHMVSVHQGFKCDICQRAFPTEILLKW